MHDKDAIHARFERRDAAENRQRILNAALRLFALHGVEQVSMNQIAIEAQIGPGTLYRRYRDKGDLCLDLLKDNIFLLFEDIEAYLKRNQTEPPQQRLKGILSVFVDFREKKAQLLAGVEDSTSSSMKRHNERARGLLYHQLHEIIAELFDEMTPIDETRRTSVFKADMLLTALRSDSYIFQRDVRGQSPEMVLEQLCLTFIPFK